MSESALTTRIKEIRRAVGDDGRAQRVIKNVRGTGYRFVAELAPDQPPTAAPSNEVARSPVLRLKPRSVERRQGQVIAYATVGCGPPLLFMPGWISSLDAFADGSDPRAALVTKLAEKFSVTVFDRYGTGLSGKEAFDPFMHYREDPAIPFAGSQQLAMGIDNTELVPMDGPYHTPPFDHVNRIADAVRAFVDGPS